MSTLRRTPRPESSASPGSGDAARAGARRARQVAPCAELRAEPASRDRDRDQRELREHERRGRRAQAGSVPGRYGSWSPTGCAPGGRHLAGPFANSYSWSTRAPAPPRQAARRRGGPAARGRRPRGTGSSPRRSRRSRSNSARGIARQAPEAKPGSPTAGRRRRSRLSPAPARPGDPVKWTTPPRVLITRSPFGRNEPLPGRPAATLGQRPARSPPGSPRPGSRRG